MKMMITVFSLMFLVASCSCFKHKGECCKGDPAKCQHEGKQHKCEGTDHKCSEGKECPMHAAPAAQVSEPAAAATPAPSATPAPDKKKK
ncbi:MAG: hypothetical protein A2X86_13590 [Bdellovibrionales bacterium GWA2_49_15]|nr:MAG: hypothetical protein A2X86_13590 [Bdellovibrionales bacterium GWA2_49_15]HAZ13559.1 hypothetical protein [Bdellovibrionales bacterium]